MRLESLRHWGVAHAASLGSTEAAVQRSGSGVPGCCVPHGRRPRPLQPARVSSRRRDGDAAATAGGLDSNEEPGYRRGPYRPTIAFEGREIGASDLGIPAWALACRKAVRPVLVAAVLLWSLGGMVPRYGQIGCLRRVCKPRWASRGISRTFCSQPPPIANGGWSTGRSRPRQG